MGKMEGKEARVYHGGTVITMDRENTVATALAISGGTVRAVGDEKSVMAAVAGAGSIEKVPLDGKCIVPGFIDSHLHPGLYIYFKTQLNLINVRGYAELSEVLREEAATRDRDEWIVGVDLMEDVFTDPAERRFPTREDLDRACPGRYVIILRHDGHICSASTPVLEKLGINARTVAEKTPEGGEIRVDGHGAPTGIFTEAATELPLELVPLPPGNRLEDASVAFSKELASFGITTCGGILQLGEEGIAGAAGAMEVPLMQVLIKKGLILQDFVFYLSTSKPRKIARVGRIFEKLSNDKATFSVGGLKVYADGSFGASTACMFEPFSDARDGGKGFMVKDVGELKRLFIEADDLGLQIIVHAIGDKANRIVVDVFDELMARGNGSNEENQGKRKNPRAHRIEHASIILPSVLEDIERLGLIVATQPAFIHSEYSWLEKRLGARRLKHTYPFKSIVKSNVVLAGASDAPVESARVLDAIQACVTRDGMVPEECLDVLDALRMFTINAAKALKVDHAKGSLEPGKDADFVILDRDPRHVPPEQIRDLCVIITVKKGSVLHRT
ncbi:MAG: amidohydrolase [Promethearchaeota archaeon]